MRFSSRVLLGIISALLIVVITPIVWFRITQGQEQAILTTNSTSYLDSASTANPASKSVPTSASAVKAELPPAMAPTQSSQDTRSLIIPVVGVTADQLLDTCTQARSNGRIHDAIDIMAPHNSRVIAAAAGRVVRLFQSKLGGTTIYELSPDGHTVYYYAHLDHYADRLTEGEQVAQGQVLGYVGDTGDAGPGNYHLHFAIWLIQDPKKFWDGENINPYTILRQVK